MKYKIDVKEVQLTIRLSSDTIVNLIFKDETSLSIPVDPSEALDILERSILKGKGVKGGD